MKVRAPGKLILTGEHAVVHGSPAIALAVDRYVTAELDEAEQDNITLSVEHIQFSNVMTKHALHDFFVLVNERYKAYLEGKLPIEKVFSSPSMLPQYVIAMLLEKFPQHFSRGLHLKLSSNIEPGCGLGSSAAAILAVLYALNHFLSIHLSDEELFALAVQAEDRQHGHTSGLDLKVSMNGGILYYQQGQYDKRITREWPFYIVNTGKPATSTGECVDYVAKYFSSPETIHQFTEIASSMDRVMQLDDIEQMKILIRKNHRLLQDIEVVPQVVSEFIDRLEAVNAAAKVCGAGAISGSAAGVVMVIADDESELQRICRAHHFECVKVNINMRGVHVV